MSEMERTYIKLENEIENQIAKISIAESSIESDKLKLSYNIVTYTKLAWYLVVIGFIVAIHGCINYAILDKPLGFSLNLIGDYLSGTLSAIWSLAGLFFIYVSFLGQRQQILDQRLEMLYSQLEVKYTRQELLGQKQELTNHRKEFEIERITDIIYRQFDFHRTFLSKLEIEEFTSKFIVNNAKYLGFDAIESCIRTCNKCIPQKSAPLSIDIDFLDLKSTIDEFFHDSNTITFLEHIKYSFEFYCDIIESIDNPYGSNKDVKILYKLIEINLAISRLSEFMSKLLEYFSSLEILHKRYGDRKIGKINLQDIHMKKAAFEEIERYIKKIIARAI